MEIGQFVQHSFRKAFEQKLCLRIKLMNYKSLNILNGFLTRILRFYKIGIYQSKMSMAESDIMQEKFYCGNYHLTSHWIESQ